MTGRTTIGSYRLGLALTNADHRVPTGRALPTWPPPPVWSWQVRQLGSAHVVAKIPVPAGCDACAADITAQAYRALQVAALNDR